MAKSHTWIRALLLVIEYDYYENSDIAAEDEEGLILALEQRNRILRIRLRIMMDTSNLQKFIMAIDEEFPILEYLIIVGPNQRTALMLPETLHGPRLHQLLLIGFIPPIRSRLLTTAVGLVTLFPSMTHPSTCFHPNDLLQCLSLMPQLEVLVIGLLFPFSHREVERQLTRTPIMTPIMFPNLRRLLFDGVSAYLEALIHRITAPCLEELNIRLANQLLFSIPRPAVYGENRKPQFRLGIFLPTRLAKHSMRWSISLLNTTHIGSHLKSTARSTTPTGRNFLGHLAT